LAVKRDAAGSRKKVWKKRSARGNSLRKDSKRSTKKGGEGVMFDERSAPLEKDRVGWVIQKQKPSRNGKL